jgi:glycerol uptake facilitator-like aquaporin
MTGSNGTAEIFFTVPRKDDLSHWNTFIDQVVCTSLLMIYIMAVTHVRYQIK